MKCDKIAFCVIQTLAKAHIPTQRINMTVIRLTRMGRKKVPFYRIVVTDSRKRRDGAWIESIGYYNPMVEPELVKFDAERLAYWKSVGAKPSAKVAAITSK